MPPHQASHRGYKWAYGQAVRERRAREEVARAARARAFMPAVPRFGVPRPGPHYPQHPGPGFPRIIGGDYDRWGGTAAGTGRRIMCFLVHSKPRPGGSTRRCGNSPLDAPPLSTGYLSSALGWAEGRAWAEAPLEPRPVARSLACRAARAAAAWAAASASAEGRPLLQPKGVASVEGVRSPAPLPVPCAPAVLQSACPTRVSRLCPMHAQLHFIPARGM